MLVGGLSDERNYSQDATLIVALWVSQICLSCSHCLVMGYIAKPTSPAHTEAHLPHNQLALDSEQVAIGLPADWSYS